MTRLNWTLEYRVPWWCRWMGLRLGGRVHAWYLTRRIKRLVRKRAFSDGGLRL